MAAYVELVIDKGTTYNTVISLTDDSTLLPINILGYNVSSQLRKSYYSSNPTANFTCSITDSANGNVLISLTETQTANIKPGRYVFDVRLQDTSNVFSRIIEGIVTITPSVTRS